MMGATVRAAAAGDLASVERLLLDAGLITAGVADHFQHFLVAEMGGRIVGSAGVELYGEHALLRSVAIAPEFRRQGLARLLVSQILGGAAAAQVRDVYLFTSTAPGFFSRLGFSPVARDKIATPVRVSQEYGACGATAQAMRLVLR